jgi:hypothetical protein
MFRGRPNIKFIQNYDLIQSKFKIKFPTQIQIVTRVCGRLKGQPFFKFPHLDIFYFKILFRLISFQNLFMAPSEARAVTVDHGFSSTNSDAEEQGEGDTLLQNRCTTHGGGHIYRPEAHTA